MTGRSRERCGWPASVITALFASMAILSPQECEQCPIVDTGESKCRKPWIQCHLGGTWRSGLVVLFVVHALRKRCGHNAGNGACGQIG